MFVKEDSSVSINLFFSFISFRSDDPEVTLLLLSLWLAAVGCLLLGLLLPFLELGDLKFLEAFGDKCWPLPGAVTGVLEFSLALIDCCWVEPKRREERRRTLDSGVLLLAGVF